MNFRSLPAGGWWLSGSAPILCPFVAAEEAADPLNTEKLVVHGSLMYSRGVSLYRP